MNKMILTSLVILFSVITQAKTIQSEELSLAPSSIDKVIRLVDKDDFGSTHKKLSVIVTDNGMSTDVTPRHTIYLGYASIAEMGNISADFMISDAYEFVSASRKSAGIYEVITNEYRGADASYKVTYTIDATQIFSDEKAQRRACGEGFCDENLKTSIVVTEKAVKE